MSKFRKARYAAANTRAARIAVVAAVMTALCAASRIPALAEQAPPPAGTVINSSNIDQYSSYFPDFMSGWFKGQYWQQCPIEVRVGPTKPAPFPKVYRDATERYRGQPRLEPYEDTHILKNYVTGQPFPDIDPKDPLAGPKVFYNYYYSYFPAVVKYLGSSRIYNIDASGNVRTTGSIARRLNIRHRSDIPPQSLVGESDELGTDDPYYVQWTMITSPEASKYAQTLTVRYDNYERGDDLWSFVPSLRRILRLTTAARCAPFLGMDYTPDDVFRGFVPGWFKYRLLGERKLLVSMRVRNQEKILDNPEQYWWVPCGFPKPDLGEWEVRDVWVLESSILKSKERGYCVSRRVFYVDKETSQQTFFEVYDSTGKFWKGGFWSFSDNVPLNIPGETEPAHGITTVNQIADYQNRHITATTIPHECNSPDIAHDLSIVKPSSMYSFTSSATDISGR